MSTAALFIIWWIGVVGSMIVWGDTLGPWTEKHFPILTTIWTTIREAIRTLGQRVANTARKVRH